MNDLVIKLDNTEAEISALLRSCSHIELTKKQGINWSILEIIEHIFITESVICEIIQGPSLYINESKEIIGRDKLNETLLVQRNNKIQTLESLKPKGILKNIETAERHFWESRKKMKDDLETGRISIDKKVFKHPYLGNMTICDWLNFLVCHTQRHIEQIKDSIKKNMKYVLIIHEVDNYEAWKKIFDNAANIRKEAGEVSYQVLKYDINDNKIVHFSTWNSHENAKKFFESPKLVQIRKEAGVKAPDFIYLEELENGVL